MPIFEYRCPMNHVNELILLSFTDERPDEIICDICGQQAKFNYTPCARNAWSWGLWNDNWIDRHDDTVKHFGKDFAASLFLGEGHRTDDDR